MAFSSRTDLATAIPVGPTLAFNKTFPSLSAHKLASGWRVSYSPAAAAAPPTGGETCDANTVGALHLPTAAAGKQWYIHSVSASASSAGGALHVYDRYAHMSGLVANITTDQAVNLTLPDRATDYSQVVAYLEYFSTPSGSTTAVTTVTISYTNQAGTAARTGTLISGLPASNSSSGTMFGPFALQDGDTGLRSVQTFTMSASTGSATAAFGIVLARPLLIVPVASQTMVRMGWAETGLPAVGASPCLWLAGSYGPTVTGTINLAEG